MFREREIQLIPSEFRKRHILIIKPFLAKLSFHRSHTKRDNNFFVCNYVDINKHFF